MDPLASHRLETRQLDVDSVLARCQTRRGVHPVAARRHDTLSVCVDVGDGDGRAWYGRARLVSHDASDFTGGHLAEGGRRIRGDAAHREEGRPYQTQTSDAHRASGKPLRTSL